MKRVGIFLVIVSLTGCDIIGGIVGIDQSPEIRSVSPGDGDANVSVGAEVNAALDLPNGGVDQTSVGEQGVRLVNAATGTVVEANVSVDNDAQTLTLEPVSELEFSSTYTFTVTSALVDVSGESFKDYTSTFSTIPEGVPYVVSTTPADGATDVPITTAIVTTGISADGGVDPSTLTAESVYLVDVDSGERVDSRPPRTSGGGDTITLLPNQPLEQLTEYQFNVTSEVRDASGEAFVPYTATFTTGSGGTSGPVDIELLEQSVAARVRHSSLAFDPSGDNLYATTIVGEIKRYPVASDGSLGTPTTINSLIQKEGGVRLTIGLTFDPASTPSNPIVWVTHTFLDPNNFDGSVGNGINAPWAGKLSRLSGPNLETVEDIVIGLPRSSKDHVTNSVAFNPAEPGVVYFVQGSNTAMGAPDSAWKFQEERVLSGAVLRLDTNLLGSTPLDVQTEGGSNYDPYASNAPLTIYATGTRNSYDLVWHTNGNLYVPANGSAAGGNIPRYDPIPGTCERRPDGGYSGPILDDESDVPAATYSNNRTDGWTITQTLDDYLFKIEEGGYYGTPNPKRCEWILNGGEVGFPGYPTTDVEQYPDSVSYDPNYRGPAGTFGQNISPDGSLEYKGNAFGNLRGKLLVTRYNQGSDVVAVTFGSDGNASGSLTESIVPQNSFNDPIDIAENPSTGYLYVSSYDQFSGEAATKAGITLLRPR